MDWKGQRFFTVQESGQGLLFFFTGLADGRSEGVHTLDIQQLAKRAARPPIDIYSATLSQLGSGFHFEIDLDNLEDPRGAVALLDCEQYSHRFSQLVSDILQSAQGEEGSGEQPPPGQRELLPPGLTEENFTLAVNSAGAERRLRIPEDLERFRNEPWKMKYRISDGVDGDKETKTEIVTYLNKEERDTGTVLSVQGYEPRRGSKKKVTGSNKTEASRKNRSKQQKQTREINLEDVVEIRLYLDF